MEKRLIILAIALTCRIHISFHASGLKNETPPVNDIYFHDILPYN